MTESMGPSAPFCAETDMVFGARAANLLCPIQASEMSRDSFALPSMLGATKRNFHHRVKRASVVARQYPRLTLREMME